jgi:hypothetical protein
MQLRQERLQGVDGPRHDLVLVQQDDSTRSHTL